MFVSWITACFLVLPQDRKVTPIVLLCRVMKQSSTNAVLSRRNDTHNYLWEFTTANLTDSWDIVLDLIARDSYPLLISLGDFY